MLINSETRLPIRPGVSRLDRKDTPTGETRLFIESSLFPIEAVNEASKIEKGPGRPPHWEMIFWWTRKPHAGARAILLASVLPAREINTREDVERFLKAVYPTIDLKAYRQGKVKFKRAPHRENPRLPSQWRRHLEDKSILDPMAGYGTIPIEAARLGFGSVYAWDLLPMARLLLKATLEYPAWLAREKLASQAIQDLKRAGEEILEKLREDPDIRELYDDDTAVYIGTWEVKCPRCGRYTPIIGNWWLARVKDSRGGYKALAYMQPEKQDDTIVIKPVDLTSELSKARTVKVTDSEITILYKTGEKQVYRLPNNGKPNKTPKKDEAICLHCQNPINQKKNGKWIIKEYIREYNQKLEDYLEGRITLEELKNTQARPRLLIKVKAPNTKQLTFHSATKEDQEKLWKALEKLRQQWPDSDVPIEMISPYQLVPPANFPILLYGFDKWYKLFNPRQLLTLVKLVKLIRETGKKIKEEKHKQGWPQEKAHKYTETITTYLTITLLKYADYSSQVAAWNQSLIMGHSLSMRGIAMIWNWDDMVPWASWTGTYLRNHNTLVNGLSYLVSAFSGSQSRISVKRNIDNGRFSVVVTDPPYLNDVAYAELSDFYYVWAKRALSDSDGFGLRPLFNGDLFFDDFGEVRTQWERFAVESLDYNRLRMEYFGLCKGEEECMEVYRRRFGEAFKGLAGRLADNGVMVVYFAHSSFSAWEILVEALLNAGLRVSAGLPVVTESEESIVSRGKHSILQSMVLALRKSSRRGVLDLDSGEDLLVERLAGFVGELYRGGHRSGVTVFNMTFAKALGMLMEYERVERSGKKLTPGELAGEAGRLAVLALVRRSGSRVRDTVGLAYAALKHALPRVGGERRRVSSDTLILMSYAIGESRRLVELGVLEPAGKPGRGADVAKRKVYVLLEPEVFREASFNALVRMSGERPRVETGLDAYRLLAAYSFRPRDVFLELYHRLQEGHPGLVAEAVELARALAVLEDEGDPDRRASRRILEYLGKELPGDGGEDRGGLMRYVG